MLPVPTRQPGPLASATVSSPRVVVLCGGRGTRAYPATLELPKPMLPVGDRPLLAHLLGIYARQGLTSFVLAAGHRADVISEWAATEADAAWDLEVVNTGDETGTGGRLRRVLDRLGDTFLATYGDGLGNIDVQNTLRAHAGHRAAGGLATMTTVPLPSQYGTIEFGESGQVLAFREKPVLNDHWINAGFFVFERSAFDAPGDDLEREILPALARDGRLYTVRHKGFWKSLDTYKDQTELIRLATDRPPWSLQ
jgi:glucose-1-phosphate cytidylyltransferase